MKSATARGSLEPPLAHQALNDVPDGAAPTPERLRDPGADRRLLFGRLPSTFSGGRCLPLLQFFELGRQAVAQRAFRTNLFQQGLTSAESFRRQLGPLPMKQVSPVSGDFLFGEQGDHLINQCSTRRNTNLPAGDVGDASSIVISQASPLAPPARPCSRNRRWHWPAESAQRRRRR